MQPHRFFLLFIVTFVFLALSAESSSCGTADNLSTSGSQTDTDYRSMAYQDAVNVGINAQYFVNQIDAESGFNPSAVSPVGAVGIAQIMPSTASEWNVDPHNAVASLQAAASHMAAYQSTYGSFDKALACYNAGCGRLEWAMKHCSDYYYCLPAQTRSYIVEITGGTP
jgi:soluble lytic murein transglycosylase-like protein